MEKEMDSKTNKPMDAKFLPLLYSKHRRRQDIAA
jgi:hypothetical protein